jgi:hypothetical protein
VELVVVVLVAVPMIITIIALRVVVVVPMIITIIALREVLAILATKEGKENLQELVETDIKVKAKVMKGAEGG